MAQTVVGCRDGGAGAYLGDEQARHAPIKGSPGDQGRLPPSLSD